MAFDPTAHLSEEAMGRVEAAHQALWESVPDLAAKWGERGRFHARQDMAFHHLFLDVARPLGSEPFADYVNWVARLLDARRIPRAVLRQALDVLADTNPPGKEILVHARDNLSDVPAPKGPPEPNPLAEFLLQGDAHGALEHLGPCNSSDDHREASKALMEAMIQVGERWARNQITVADEHLATMTSQRIIAGIRDTLPIAPPSGRLIAACVEGNHHDLGLRVTADRCASAGWDCILLGADVPTDHLVRMAGKRKPQAVLLSASLAPHVMVTKGVVEALRNVGVSTIYVGGQAFAKGGDLWRLTGADGHAEDALELLAS